jgi:hypothetical protein
MEITVLQKTASWLVRPAIGLGVIAALLFVAAPSIPAQQFRGGGEQDRGHNTIVGTWLTTASLTSPVPPGFPPDGHFEAIETFYSDGTMNVDSQLAGATIGAGVWKQTGRDRFTCSFSFYRLDTSIAPPDSPFNHVMLGANVMANVLMLDSDHYITTDVISPLTGNLTPCLTATTPPSPLRCGTPIAFLPATVAAVRYQFSNFNTKLP